MLLYVLSLPIRSMCIRSQYCFNIAVPVRDFNLQMIIYCRRDQGGISTAPFYYRCTVLKKVYCTLMHSVHRLLDISPVRALFLPHTVHRGIHFLATTHYAASCVLFKLCHTAIPEIV